MHYSWIRKVVLVIFLFPRYQNISLRCTFQNMRINFFKLPEVSRANELQECSFLAFHCKRHQSLSSPSLNAKASGLLYHLNDDFPRKEISPLPFFPSVFQHTWARDSWDMNNAPRVSKLSHYHKNNAIKHLHQAGQGLCMCSEQTCSPASTWTGGT